jgi:hypothetical protein
MLPLVLLAAPAWKYFHPTHSWMEGKIRTEANRELAPDTVKQIHCDVNGAIADCRFTTSDGHSFTVHVTKSGNTWTEERAVQVS